MFDYAIIVGVDNKERYLIVGGEGETLADCKDEATMFIIYNKLIGA